MKIKAPNGSPGKQAEQRAEKGEAQINRVEYDDSLFRKICFEHPPSNFQWATRLIAFEFNVVDKAVSG